MSALVAALVLGAGLPVLAHGGEGEAEAINLIEQALAILVNSPEAVGETVERVEEVLAMPADDRAGLDGVALEQALAALEAGEWHQAEESLIVALGREPHPSTAVEPGEGTTGEEEEAGSAPAYPQFGETERVEFGWRAPASADWLTLAGAAVVAVAAIVMMRRREV